jgi:CBS domain-containing membrane protein
MHSERPFHQLVASDLMSRELFVIPDDMPAQEAARVLVRHRIGGAPVVDCRRVLVGVVSCSDFVREMTKGDSSPLECGSGECVYSDWQVVDIDALTTEAVRHCMTADPVTADERTPIAELARMMVDAGIHRVVIVDSNYSPCGIVTTTDILGAVSRFAIESAAGAETDVNAVI